MNEYNDLKSMKFFGREVEVVEWETLDDFEVAFEHAMSQNYFVADVDDLKSKKVGYIVFNGDGVVWHLFSQEVYEKFIGSQLLPF